MWLSPDLAHIIWDAVYLYHKCVLIFEALPVCAYDYISKLMMYNPSQEDLSVAPNFSLQHNMVHIMAVVPAHSASSVCSSNDSSQQVAWLLNAYLLLFV